jgi:hypothetical protein
MCSGTLPDPVDAVVPVLPIIAPAFTTDRERGEAISIDADKEIASPRSR